MYYCTNKDGEVEPLNYCVAIKTGTTSTETPLWSVGGIPWNNPSWNKYKGKKCHVYEFFTNVPEGKNSSNWIANTTDKFFLLPEAYHTVTFKQSSTAGGSQFTIGATFTGSLGVVTGNIIVSSIGNDYTGGTISFMKAEVVLNSGDTRNYGETSVVASGSPFTLGSETSKTWNISITTTTLDSVSNYMVRVTYRTTTMSANVIKTYMIRASIDGGDIPKV